MYELNEQELEQVAGGHHHHYVTYGSAGQATATGYSDLGAGTSQAGSTTFVNACYTKSTAVGQSAAIGFGAEADSAAATTGSFYAQ